MLIRLICMEYFRSVDEVGEYNMSVLKIIIDVVIKYIGKLVDDEYILIVDCMYVDLIYFEFRVIILF